MANIDKKQCYIKLWDYIKDKPRVYSLTSQINSMFINDELTKEEYWFMDEDIRKRTNFNFFNGNTHWRKRFVTETIIDLSR